MADDAPVGALVVRLLAPARDPDDAAIRSAAAAAASADALAAGVPPAELTEPVAILPAIGRPAAPARRAVGPLAIEPATRRVTLAGRPLELTRGEYELLARLAAAPGHVFTKQQLLGAIWGQPAGGRTRRLDAQVARLRRRLGDHRALLVTVWGVGYRLGAPERR